MKNVDPDGLLSTRSAISRNDTFRYPSVLSSIQAADSRLNLLFLPRRSLLPILRCSSRHG